MTGREVREYIQDALIFFREYSKFLENGDTTTEEPTHNTGTITLWVNQIADLNVKWIIARLENFIKDIPPEIQEYTFYNLWNDIRGRNSANSLVENKSMVDNEDLSQAVRKTTEYLLRAKELLQIHTEEFSQSAFFIPTNSMFQRNLSMHKLFATCVNIIAKHSKNIPLGIQQQKSWLTRELHLGGLLSRIQRAAFGLFDNWQSKLNNRQFIFNTTLPERKYAAISELKTVVQKLNSFSPLCRPTNKTKRRLGCLEAEEIPIQKEHYNYFPLNIRKTLNNFKEAMGNTSNECINGMDVLNITKTQKMAG
ncbi:MAG: hypothetical protein JSS07_10925 [Proteobacteria bacterium]|nr:hypothetical protein [Pseudomonadota bacterium]